MSFRACFRFLRVRPPLLFIWLLVLGTLAVRTSQAQVIQMKPKVSACDPSLVDAAMEVTRLKDMGKLMSDEVGPMFAQMEQTLRARGRRLLPGERNQVFGMMQQAFAAEAVDEEVERSLRSHCEPKIFAAAVEQLRTPFAIKMRSFEDQFNRSHSTSAVSRYAAFLQQHPPTETREALVEAMEKTVHQADFTADTNAQVILAIYMVLTGKATDDGQLSEIRDRMMPAARKGSRTEFLMVYRNVTDEELDQYVMLLRTPELQRFQTIYKSAVQNVIVRRSQVLAAMIKQHLDSRGGKH
jgi:hypothetical protein